MQGMDSILFILSRTPHQNILDFFPRHRIESGCGFVENQQHSSVKIHSFTRAYVALKESL